MVMIYQIPSWFKFVGIMIDLFAILVSVLIVYHSYKYYKFNKHRSLLFFAGAFFLMAISLVCKLALHSGIFYSLFLKTEHYDNLHFFTTEIFPITTLTFYTTTIFVWLTLVAIFLLYLNVRGQGLMNTTAWYVILLLGIIAYTNPHAYIFFGLNAMLFLYITYKYTRRFLESQHSNLLTTLLAFVWLTVSQMVFMFANPVSYVVAEIMQLIGFFMLFTVLIKLGREKKYVTARRI